MVKNTPVCSCTATLFIIIFMLYYANLIKNEYGECEVNLWNSFTAKFHCKGWMDLILLILKLVSFSEMEEELGTKKFLSIFLLCLVINTVAENFVHRKLGMPCTTGIDSVLYSLAVWDLFFTAEVNRTVLFTSFLSFVGPMAYNKGAVVTNSLGAAVGVLTAVVYKCLAR